MSADAVQTQIKAMVDDNPVLLFMKGTPTFPQCGFSSTVVRVLEVVGVDYAAVNVLEDMDVREGVKAFSNWPTIPQLYVKGEFVGGCDIVREMYETGELKALLADKGLLAAEA